MTDLLPRQELLTADDVLGVGSQLDGREQQLPLVLPLQESLVFWIVRGNIGEFYQSTVRKVSLE